MAVLMAGSSSARWRSLSPRAACASSLALPSARLLRTFSAAIVAPGAHDAAEDHIAAEHPGGPCVRIRVRLAD